ncbi:MAG: riboflavin synthase [Bacteroidetes bacterium]|nr:riboflavin synthase [Bacteroidota bacterium]
MFTGIVEQLGLISSITQQGDNLDFWIESPFTAELKIDQSVAHNGVCLTVVEVSNTKYRVTAVAETLHKTTLKEWKPQQFVNLERAIQLGSRLDGHFVQGHVDSTGICLSRQALEGSYLFQFSFPEAFSALIIEKGSICINGVSLTAFHLGRTEFMVTIIPYTYQHTNFQWLKEGDSVNLEFDVLGKYLLRAKEVGF